jgi:hypothetical protein
MRGRVTELPNHAPSYPMKSTSIDLRSSFQNWLKPSFSKSKIVFTQSVPNEASGQIHIFIDFGQHKPGLRSTSLHINGLFELERCRRAIQLVHREDIPVAAWWIRGLSLHPAPLYRKVKWIDSIAKISGHHYIYVVTEAMSDKQKQQLFARLNRLDSPIEFE